MKKNIMPILAGILLMIPGYSFTGHGGAIAGGVFGGLLGGALIGSAISHRRDRYYDPYYDSYSSGRYYYVDSDYESENLAEQNYQLRKQLEMQQEQIDELKDKAKEETVVVTPEYKGGEKEAVVMSKEEVGKGEKGEVKK